MALDRYGGHFQPGQDEWVLYSKKDIELAFLDHTHPNEKLKSSCIPGKVYLTNKRFAFENTGGKIEKCKIKDFSSCFGSISKLDIKQPIFGANAVTGTSSGEPGPDGFAGSVDWKMSFKSGGAIDFGKLLVKTAKNPPVIRPGQGSFGSSGQGSSSMINQPGYQTADGTFHFPPAGSMPANSAPPGYLQNTNTFVGDAPPLYDAPANSFGNRGNTNSNMPPEYANSGKN